MKETGIKTLPTTKKKAVAEEDHHASAVPNLSPSMKVSTPPTTAKRLENHNNTGEEVKRLKPKTIIEKKKHHSSSLKNKDKRQTDDKIRSNSQVGPGATTTSSSPNTNTMKASSGGNSADVPPSGAANNDDDDHIEYGSGYEMSGRTFREDSSTIATAMHDNVGDPFASTTTAATTTIPRSSSVTKQQVGAYEINVLNGGDGETDSRTIAVADGEGATTASAIGEGMDDDVTQDVKAQVVSQEQLVQEAFDIVQKQVEHAEVMDMDELLADEAARHKRRFIALIVGFLVLVGVVISVVVVLVKRTDGDDIDNDEEEVLSFDLPAPNGKWELGAFFVNSTCGHDQTWRSSISINVLEETTTDNVNGNTTSTANTNDIYAVETFGIKSEENMYNGTYDANIKQLILGPGSYLEYDNSGITTFTFYIEVISEIYMEGRQEWTWRKHDDIASSGRNDGRNECVNGTAHIVLDRVG